MTRIWTRGCLMMEVMTSTMMWRQTQRTPRRPLGGPSWASSRRRRFGSWRRNGRGSSWWSVRRSGKLWIKRPWKKTFGTRCAGILKSRFGRQQRVWSPWMTRSWITRGWRRWWRVRCIGCTVRSIKGTSRRRARSNSTCLATRSCGCMC